VFGQVFHVKCTEFADPATALKFVGADAGGGGSGSLQAVIENPITAIRAIIPKILIVFFIKHSLL